MSSADKMDRRKYIKLLGIGAVTGVAGCAGESGESTVTETDVGAGQNQGGEGGHLRVAIPRTTSTLNPVMMGSKFTERWAVKMFYSTLTRLNPNLNIYGDLATEWSPNNNSDEWTFKLRDNAKFHSGNPVTATDVKATFETVYNKDVGSPGAGTMGDIKSVEAVDETTVRFKLGGGNSDFPKLVAKGWGSIVPKDIVTNANKRKSLGSEEHGSGPFVLEDFEAGDHTTGIRNEDYYHSDSDGNALPYVAKVTQRTIPEASGQVNALRNKEVDILWEPPTDKWGQLQQLNGVQTERVPAGNISNFIMDVNQKPFDDPKVRQAIMWAIDRKAIIEGALNGLGTVAQDSPVSPAYEFFADLDERGRDIKKAKKLLAEAGYPDGFDLKKDFDVTFYSAADPPHRLRSAVLIKEQLKEVGITFQLQQISYDKYISDVWTKAPAYMGSYGMRISGANFMRLLLHSEGGWNGESHFSDEEFDTAIEKATGATNKEKKMQFMKTAQQVVYDHGPYAIPFYTDQIGASRNYVQNYKVSPLTYLFYPDEYKLGSNAPTR